MLKNSSLRVLQGKKNLLAFSAGSDSTALFFLLLEHEIPFDIAIVDYGMREQSKEEVAYAKELANKYHCNIHLYTAERIEKNFEANARAIRYSFFEKTIAEHNYDNLLTAHHLGDRFEWMLMQFCKGAGCVEIAGMQELQQRDNYTLVRPLLEYDKSELLKYLQQNELKYFEDNSNLDESFTRNSFRHQHTNPLLEKYRPGIQKSFQYIDADVPFLTKETHIKTIKDFAYFITSGNQRSDIVTIDKYLKQQGYMASASEKEDLKNSPTSILGRKFLVTQTKEYVFISPYSNQKENMEKEFKEKCRILKIDPKLRSYLHKNKEIFVTVKKLLGTI